MRTLINYSQLLELLENHPESDFSRFALTPTIQIQDDSEETQDGIIDIQNGIMEIVDLLSSGRCPANLAFRFQNIPLSQADIAKLTAALQSTRLPSGLHWIFIGNKLSDADITPLANFLASGNCPDNFTLQINDNRLEEGGFKSLIAAISGKAAPVDLTLNLVGNEIWPPDMQFFAQALKTQTFPDGLKLNLTQNYFKKDEKRAIVDALSERIYHGIALSRFELFIDDANSNFEPRIRQALQSLEEVVANKRNMRYLALCLISVGSEYWAADKLAFVMPFLKLPPVAFDLVPVARMLRGSETAVTCETPERRPPDTPVRRRQARAPLFPLPGLPPFPALDLDGDNYAAAPGRARAPLPPLPGLPPFPALDLDGDNYAAAPGQARAPLFPLPGLPPFPALDLDGDNHAAAPGQAQAPFPPLPGLPPFPALDLNGDDYPAAPANAAPGLHNLYAPANLGLPRAQAEETLLTSLISLRSTRSSV